MERALSPQTKILVVDDEPDVADSLKLLLEALDYDVCVSYTGASAVGIAGRYRPHVVILDINMPGLNGLQTAWRMQRDRRLQRAVFIAHTAEDEPFMRTVANRNGFHHFIPKGKLSAMTTMLDVLSKIASNWRPSAPSGG